jgi:hypothetical protein
MRLRFTIRDLLLTTVIVALALGWWLDHRRLAKYEEEYRRLRIFYPGQFESLERQSR